jgi:hypothetical protein
MTFNRLKPTLEEIGDPVVVAGPDPVHGAELLVPPENEGKELGSSEPLLDETHGIEFVGDHHLGVGVEQRTGQ